MAFIKIYVNKSKRLIQGQASFFLSRSVKIGGHSPHLFRLYLWAINSYLCFANNTARKAISVGNPLGLDLVSFISDPREMPISVCRENQFEIASISQLTRLFYSYTCYLPLVCFPRDSASRDMVGESMLALLTLLHGKLGGVRRCI